MSIKRTCLHIVFSLFMLIYCGGEHEGSPKIEQLSFAVCDSLLGSVYVDSISRFSFHPPLGWEQVPDTTLYEAKRKLTEAMDPNESIRIEPLQFFIDVRSRSSCCLSRLTGFHVTNQTLDSLGEYRSLLKAKFPETKIEEGAFRVDDVNVYQFLITDNERVTFKLVCWGSSRQVVQVDYVVPFSLYRESIKAIESSIGSFKMLP